MKLNLKIEISSLSVAILLAANSLCWPLSSVSNILLLILMIALVLHLLGGNQLLYKDSVLLIAWIMLLYGMSFFRNPNNTVLFRYFLSFISLGYVGIIAACGRFDIQKVVTYLCLLSILLIPFLRSTNFEDLDYGAWMGISYGTLKYIMALVYAIFFLDWKSSKYKKWRFLLFLPLLFYVRLYVEYASRGAVLSLLVFVIFAFIIKMGFKNKAALFLLTLIFILAYLYFNPIIMLFSTLLDKMGLHLYAFDKILLYESADNLDNGRISLVEKGLALFYDNMIVGNGVGFYEDYYKTIYVHNMIVQLLDEGGILFATPILLFTFFPIMMMFNKRIKQEKRIFLSFLFASSVIQLLFSDFLWRSQNYWFYMMYSIVLYKQLQNTKQFQKMNIK